MALYTQIFINCYAPPVQAGLIRKYQDQSVEIDGPELAKVQAAAQQYKSVSQLLSQLAIACMHVPTSSPALSKSHAVYHKLYHIDQLPDAVALQDCSYHWCE